MKKILLPFLIVLAMSTISMAQTELILNGSFETGDTTNWSVSAVNNTNGANSSCTENWRVQDNSLNLCCCVTEIVPTDGIMAAFTSFDADVPNTDWIIEQTVMLPSASLTSANVSFDFKANMDFGLGGTATIPRELSVDFYTTGGAFIANIFSDSTFVSAATINIDYSQNIDVLSSLSGLQGTSVVLRFTASIPEVATGPGKALIDDVSLLVTEGSIAPCGATELVVGAPAASYTNDSASVDFGEPKGSCWTDSAGNASGVLDNTVWFYFVAPADGEYFVSTNFPGTPNDDTQIAAYTLSNGCADFSGYTEIGCGEDIDVSNWLSEMTTSSVTSGDTVYVQVDGWAGTVGQFDIQVTQSITGFSNDVYKYAEIYPNPAKDRLLIKAISESIDRIEIIDIMGRTMMISNENITGTKEINVSELIPGNYLIKLNLGKEEILHRFMIQR